MDKEWDHNHSLETLETSNFRDLSPECTERVLKLFESGHTPATARQQYLKELKESCQDELGFHRKNGQSGSYAKKKGLYTFCCSLPENILSFILKVISIT